MKLTARNEDSFFKFQGEPDFTWTEKVFAAQDYAKYKSTPIFIFDRVKQFAFILLHGPRPN